MIRIALQRAVLGLATALTASLSPALAQVGASWQTQGGDQQGTRYSTLTDITTANVGTLVEEFNYPTSAKGSHQGGPLVIGNIMYVVTPFPNNLIALDLTHPGRALWTYQPKPGGYARGLTCCDIVNRGAVYANGLVVYELLDGNVVAVDATKGTQVWRTQAANPWQGETLNTAPIIVNNKVILGSSGSEMGVRGSLRALDLATGKLLWQAYSTGPDSDVLIGSNFHPFYAADQGANLGQTTWQGTQWQQGGGTIWGWITYDPATNQIFYGTSQPGTFNADQRPGQNKWGSTVFARNPDTGQANWAYQLAPHDNFDFDAANEFTVVDLAVNGKPRQALVHFNKNGFAFIMDRVTGQLISAPQFSFQNWTQTGYDLGTGQATINPALTTHQGSWTKDICPSAFGAKDWEWSSYSPVTGLFYFGAHNFCMDYYGVAANYIAGTPFTGVSINIYPGSGGNMGEFVAFDPVKGQRAWSVTEPLAVFGGAMATAGGVVFYGTMDKQFKAVDAGTGKLLWSTTLECGVASPPISYQGPDGKQRIAITTGLGRLQGGFAGGECPQGDWYGNGDARHRPAGGAMPQAQAADTYFAKLSQHDAKAPPANGPTSGFVHVFKLP
jgi:alcohol dehydrogenase (cytochrome c)